MSRTPLSEGTRVEALALVRESYRRVLGVVRRTPGLLALSFLLGISLWVFVTDTENPTVVGAFPAPIPVEAVNVGQSLAVANQLSAVDLRVAAAADRWERMTGANFRAYVDLNGFDARSQEVPVRVEVVGVSGVRVVDTSPRSIVVNLEDFVSNKVPVSTRTVGQLPIGYELGTILPAVSTVTVSGPVSLVALVTQAVADVNVTGLTVGVEAGVTMKPLGAGGGEIRGVRIEPATVKVATQVIQSTIVRTVPLTVDVVGEPDTGYRVSAVRTAPVTVRIQGPVAALQQLDSLALPAVNVAGARADIARSLAIPLPPGVSLVDSQRATVTVNIAVVNGSQRATFAVQALNVPRGLVAQLARPNVEVVLSGPQPALNALLTGDVKVTVDIGARGAGAYTLPVVVSAPAGIVVQSVQPETVNVTIASP